MLLLIYLSVGPHLCVSYHSSCLPKDIAVSVCFAASQLCGFIVNYSVCEYQLTMSSQEEVRACAIVSSV